MKLIYLLITTAMLATGLSAANFNANSTATLAAAINNANNTAGADTVTITGSITLTSLLPKINSDIAFIGGGNTISGNNVYRIFWINSGTVSFSDMTLTDGLAKGGDGGAGANYGGGGGLGAGGAILIRDASVTCTNCMFTNNSAVGGDTGMPLGASGSSGGGGGGGLSGNGNDRHGSNNAGGRGGLPNGGAGGAEFKNGHSGSYGGGGGGGGGFGTTPGRGGAGGFGGGGGAGIGSARSGGAGGFGAGGGAGNAGGAGGGTQTGITGSLGGNGNTNTGGGGAGLGGAVFIDKGTITLTTCTFDSNTATAGGGNIFGQPALPGQGHGGAIFVRNGATLNPTGIVLSGNTSTTGSSNVYPGLPIAVSSIVRLSPSGFLTNAASVTFQVNFTSSVAGISSSNFDLTTTGITGASISSVTGTSTQRNVVVNTGSSTGSAAGTIRLDMINTTGVAPSLTNTPFTTGDVYIVDKTTPTVSSIVRKIANPTNASSVTFTVTFSKIVSGVTTGNFALDSTGVSGAAISTVQGSGDSRTVTVDTGSGDGSISIDLLTVSGISDLASNPLVSGYVAGESYTIDKTDPGISIGAPSAATTTTGPVDFIITYTDASSITLASGDVSLVRTGTANGTVSVNGTGTTTRTVTISAISGDGTIGISINADSATDDAANGAPAAGPSTTFGIISPPTIVIGTPSVTVTKDGPVDFVITYTGATAVTLDAADITLNTASIVNRTITVTGTGTTTRTVTINSITGDGDFSISIAADTASNTAGNSAAAGPSPHVS